MSNVQLYLQADELTRPFWFEVGDRSQTGAEWSREEGIQGEPDVPCLRPVDTVTRLVLLHRHLYIYWPSSERWPCIGSNCVCFCASIRRRSGRCEGRVVNNDFLVSVWLLKNIYLGQGALSSVPFHFTNKPEIHWLIHRHRVFFISSPPPFTFQCWKCQFTIYKVNINVI